MEQTYFNPKVDLERNIIQINGPINAIRLEGNVDGIKKIIYLFMDAHINVANQTECLNIFSQDFHQYLANSFYELNKTSKIYDFFFEIYPTRVPLVEYEEEFMLQKQKYVWQVYKFFKKIFKYNPKENRVEISDLFHNVRLHYIDLRDYFEAHIIEKLRIINGISDDISNGISADLLDEMIGIFKEIEDDLKKLLDILKNTKDIPNKDATIRDKEKEDIDETTMKHLAYKFRYRYNHAEIKKILNDRLEKVLDDFVAYNNFIDDTIRDLDRYIDIILNTNKKLLKDDRITFHYDYGLSSFDQRQIIKNINDITDMAESKFTNMFVKLVDIYFLRRFLDKDYITNAIAYTGAAHSANYVFTLVNYFGFKITHIAYSETPNLDTLNKEIIGAKSMEDVLGMLMKPKEQQCSDITHFPNNFA